MRRRRWRAGSELRCHGLTRIKNLSPERRRATENSDAASNLHRFFASLRMTMLAGILKILIDPCKSAAGLNL